MQRFRGDLETPASLAFDLVQLVPAAGTGFATPLIMLAVAAALPIAVGAGVLAVITQGLWPSGLVATLGLLVVAGTFTLFAVDRILRRSRPSR